MTIWACLLLLMSGVLLCNGIPHLVNGLSGRTFPTPFSRPPGTRPSSPLVNVLWGSANLVLGVWLLVRRAELAAGWPGAVALALGFVVTGVLLARRFGQLHGSDTR